MKKFFEVVLELLRCITNQNKLKLMFKFFKSMPKKITNILCYNFGLLIIFLVCFIMFYDSGNKNDKFIEIIKNSNNTELLFLEKCSIRDCYNINHVPHYNTLFEKTISEGFKSGIIEYAIAITTCSCPSTPLRITGNIYNKRDKEFFIGMDDIQRKEELESRHSNLIFLFENYSSKIKYYTQYSDKKCKNFDIFENYLKSYSCIIAEEVEKNEISCGLKWFLFLKDSPIIYVYYGNGKQFAISEERDIPNDRIAGLLSYSNLEAFKKSDYYKFLLQKELIPIEYITKNRNQ